MEKGDDAFTSGDFAGMKAVHHPNMIAHVTGRADPIYGEPAHAAMIEGMFRSFPDVHVHNDPYPNPVRKRRLDHRGHPRHRDFTGETIMPDGKVIAPTGKAYDLAFAMTAKREAYGCMI